MVFLTSSKEIRESSKIKIKDIKKGSITQLGELREKQGRRKKGV